MNINTVILTGNLTKDVDLKYTQNGKAKATMILAVDRMHRENQQQTADFPRIVVWDKLAEHCERYLKKGSAIAVEGRITTGKYDANGETIYTTDVTADKVQFLTSVKKEEY